MNIKHISLSMLIALPGTPILGAADSDQSTLDSSRQANVAIPIPPRNASTDETEYSTDTEIPTGLPIDMQTPQNLSIANRNNPEEFVIPIVEQQPVNINAAITRITAITERLQRNYQPQAERNCRPQTDLGCFCAIVLTVILAIISFSWAVSAYS